MGTEDLITAKQAKECTNAYRKTIIDNEVKKIKEAIKNAMSERKYFTIIDGIINKDTRNIFENLGYKISIHQGRYNEQHTVIDWSGDE